MVQTLFNEPKTASQAAFIARIYSRALTLWEAGYRVSCVLKTRQHPMYLVYSPEGAVYAVCSTCRECNCEGHKKHKDCKHRIAVALLEKWFAEEVDGEQFEAQYAEWKAMMDDAECATGCDYRY